MRAPITLFLALWLLGIVVMLLRHEPEPPSTGGSALLRPELHRMSEP